MGHTAGDADGGTHEDGWEVSTRTSAPPTRNRAVALAITAFVCLAAAAPRSAAAQTWRTITSARQLHGEREMAVHVQYGAGRFRLSPGTGGELYRMEMRYDEDTFIPVREYDPAVPSVRLGLSSRERSGVHVSLGDRRRDGENPPTLDVALTPDIPLTLTLEMGAVEAVADLGGLALRRVTYRTGASATHVTFSRPNPVECEALTIEAGAAEFRADDIANANCARVTFRGGVGKVSLDFGGSWRRSMTGDVTVGIGSLSLRLPRDVGVEVRLNRFLASFDAAGFEKRGGAYYSGNFNSARYRLVLDVNATFGGVEVAWIN